MTWTRGKTLDDIRTDYEAGEMMLKEIAAKYNLSEGTIVNCMKRLGIPLRGKGASGERNRRKFSQTEEDEIVSLYDQGYSSVWIGEKFDYYVAGITDILKRYGRWIRASRNWTDAQEAEIAQEYLGGKSTRQIARERGVDKIGIIDALRRQGVEQRDPASRNRLYALNPHVFDVIDNEWTAYHWGFLWADGHVHKRSLVVSLKSTDAVVLERMKVFMESESPVTIRRNSIGKAGYEDKVYLKAHIEFTDSHLATRMRELGIVTGRPSVQPIIDYLPSHLIHHWIRGFMDGDGTVSEKKNGQGFIGFCGDESLMLFVRDCLAYFVGTSSTKLPYKHATANLYYMDYSGNAQCVRIRDWLYQDATIWLERKRERAEQIRERR